MDKELKNQIVTFQQNVAELVIQDDDTYLQATESMTKAKQYKLEVIAHYKPMKVATQTALDVVKQEEKSFLEPLKTAYEKVCRMVADYNQKKEDEAEEKRKEIAKKLQAEKEAEVIDQASKMADEGRHEEADELLDEPVFVAPPVVKAAPKAAGISFRNDWKFEIENKKKIPLHLMMPNEKLIGQLVRAQKADFNEPGIKTWPVRTPINKG